MPAMALIQLYCSHSCWYNVKIITLNSFLHRPFPLLPNWFHRLLDHIMFLFCSTLDLFAWCARLSRLERTKINALSFTSFPDVTFTIQCAVYSFWRMCVGCQTKKTDDYCRECINNTRLASRSGQLFFYMTFASRVNVYMVSVHTGST